MSSAGLWKDPSKAALASPTHHGEHKTRAASASGPVRVFSLGSTATERTERPKVVALDSRERTALPSPTRIGVKATEGKKLGARERYSTGTYPGPTKRKGSAKTKRTKASDLFAAAASITSQSSSSSATKTDRSPISRSESSPQRPHSTTFFPPAGSSAIKGGSVPAFSVTPARVTTHILARPAAPPPDPQRQAQSLGRYGVAAPSVTFTASAAAGTGSSPIPAVSSHPGTPALGSGPSSRKQASPMCSGASSKGSSPSGRASGSSQRTDSAFSDHHLPSECDESDHHIDSCIPSPCNVSTCGDDEEETARSLNDLVEEFPSVRPHNTHLTVSTSTTPYRPSPSKHSSRLPELVLPGRRTGTPATCVSSSGSDLAPSPPTDTPTSGTFSSSVVSSSAQGTRDKDKDKEHTAQKEHKEDSSGLHSPTKITNVPPLNLTKVQPSCPSPRSTSSREATPLSSPNRTYSMDVVSSSQSAFVSVSGRSQWCSTQRSASTSSLHSSSSSSALRDCTGSSMTSPDSTARERDPAVISEALASIAAMAIGGAAAPVPVSSLTLAAAASGEKDKVAAAGSSPLPMMMSSMSLSSSASAPALPPVVRAIKP